MAAGVSGVALPVSWVVAPAEEPTGEAARPGAAGPEAGVAAAALAVGWQRGFRAQAAAEAGWPGGAAVRVERAAAEERSLLSHEAVECCAAEAPAGCSQVRCSVECCARVAPARSHRAAEHSRLAVLPADCSAEDAERSPWYEPVGCSVPDVARSAAHGIVDWSLVGAGHSAVHVPGD